MAPKYKLFKNDIPSDVDWGGSVAIDTETMGLIPVRDRLCLVQLSSGSGQVVLVQMDRYDASPNLSYLLENDACLKIFHFARFDVAVLQHYLGVNIKSVYCTKVGSKLARTNTERHGLPDLCSHFLSEKLLKEQQRSDWGCEDLTHQQLAYAASDVIHLHALKSKIDALLAREGRSELFKSVCSFIPTCAKLDLMQTDYRYLMEH